MLDPQEVKQFQEIVQQTVKGEIIASEHRMLGKIEASEQRMVLRIDEAIEASEQRMVGRIESAVKASEGRTIASVKQLGNDIADFIDASILPQISEKADEKVVKKLAEKTLEHEATFKKIKAVFVN